MTKTAKICATASVAYLGSRKGEGRGRTYGKAGGGEPRGRPGGEPRGRPGGEARGRPGVSLGEGRGRA